MRSMVYQVANSHGLGRRELGHHWQTSLIDGDMMFATELSPIRAIGLGLIPTGGGENAGRVDAGAFSFDPVIFSV